MVSFKARWLVGAVLMLQGPPSFAPAVAEELPDEASFRNPPPESRPNTLYFWMNGNVTREGLDADLEAMAKIGLGGALMFDGSSDVPKGPVDYLSPQWLDLMIHMMKRADELGLKVGLHNAPGWSSSGGPWITPEKSMQQLVWTETRVEGGKPLTVVLAAPYAKMGYYADAAVLAFPASNADDATWQDAVVRISAGDVIAPDRLTDRDLHTSTKITPDHPLVIEVKAPFTARSVTLYGGVDAKAFSANVESSNDGKTWTRVAQVSVPVVHERGIEAPGSVNFPPATGRYYRIVPKAPADVAEVFLHAAPRVEDWAYKGEHLTHPMTADAPEGSPLSAGDAIDPAKIVDLSDKLDANGTLRWSPPKGRWTILRLGHTTTGHLNVAASDSGRGLEVDKFDRDAVDYQWNNSVARLVKAAGPLAGTTFNFLEIDSFEAGLQNWTADLPAMFEERNGYSIKQYLPALTGRIVGDRETSDRFLFDFRRTLADLMADNYYGRMADHARDAGLTLHVEGYGPGAFDPMQVSGKAPVPMTEFWSRTPWTDNRSVKMVTSAANVYGKNIVAVEAFTGEAQTSRWQDYPYAMKTLGDQMFAQGINQIFFHRYAHQPNPNAFPGMTMGPWGINLERSNTWFAQARPWIEYLTRTQFLLRQGHHVADVLYFVGEESPNQAEGVRPNVSPDTNPLIGWSFKPGVPAGHDYDLVNAEVLMTRATVDHGDIVLPTGARYKMLVFPESTSAMTPALATRLHEMVVAGATILGPRPTTDLTLADGAKGTAEFRSAIDSLWGEGGTSHRRMVGAGRVYSSGTIEQVLGDLKIGADADCSTLNPDGQLVWQHRQAVNGEIYFVASRQRRTETVTCTFRVGHAQPSLWNAENGSVEQPAMFRTGPDSTTVTFDLPPAGSTIVRLDPTDRKKGIEWIARNGKVVSSVEDRRAQASVAPSGSFTQMLWAKPDIDLRVMPQERVEGRINETGKNYLVNARSGVDLYGPGTAVAGLAIGRNGSFVIERASPDSVPAVLVSDTPIAGWTHVALVYENGTPTLYLNGKVDRTGLKSGRTVFAGGSDAPAPTGVTYFFEGNSTPLETFPRALSAEEISAAAARGIPAPQHQGQLVDVTLASDDQVHGLAWKSGEYSASDGGVASAVVPAPLTLDGPWEVTFQADRGAPAQTTMRQLESLSRNPDEGIRHFAGTATYSRNFSVPVDRLGNGRRLYLDLGRVEVVAGITINGRDVGISWKEPYRVDITDAVHAGANTLEIKVSTLWVNRLIGDAALPEEGKFVDGDWAIGESKGDDGSRDPVMARKIVELPGWYRNGDSKPAGGRTTFSTWTFFQKDEPLVDSGLLGPVRLVSAQEIIFHRKHQ